MIVTLQSERVQTLADVRAVIDGNDRLDYQFTDREAAYEFIRRTLVRFNYPTLSKPDKGVIGRYLAKMTGLSRAQMTRLVGQHRATGRVTDRRGGAPVRPFERRYTGADIRVLAEVDAALGDMSGPATRAVMRREFEVFGQRRFERLARLSNGHLYNLRRSRTYQRKRTTFTKTRPTPVAIGERRKPRPDGQPGFLRVDTVHQGDLDGVKGVYHINTVDEVTQYEHIGCVQAISERFLLPVLEANLQAYPFPIQGFHTDNGSEYINQRVAALLNKLHIGEFTKSRARKSNDNALVEGKNAAVVRKHLGYDHIPQRFSARVNAFTHDVLSPFLNHHRPCLFPTEQRDHKGKIKKRYRDQDIATPYEKLKSPSQCRDVPQTRRHLPTTRCHRLCPKRPRRRPRSQCRPRRTVPNHRLRVGTRRRVTPPSHTARLSQQPPASSGPPAHRRAGSTCHRLHSRIDSPPH